MAEAPRTLFEKIWSRHRVLEREDGQTLLYVGRHLLHRPIPWTEEIARLIGTGAGLIFKGSGFYITDYRSDSYKEAAKKDAPAAPAAAGEKTTGAKEPKTSTTTPAAPAKAAGYFASIRAGRRYDFEPDSRFESSGPARRIRTEAAPQRLGPRSTPQ